MEDIEANKKTWGYFLKEVLEEYEKEDSKVAALKINPSKEVKEKLNRMLSKLKKAHEQPEYELESQDKGDLLEEIIFEIFNEIEALRIVKNARTATNEIDFLVKLSPIGRVYKEFNIIPKWFPDKFLVECKNHDSTISVGYVGKFRSLMEVTSTRLGLFISYYGFTGKSYLGWRAATGYIKKLALINPDELKKDIIIDIDFELLKEIINKDFKDTNISIFDLICDQKDALLADISQDFNEKYEHPNENEF